MIAIVAGDKKSTAELIALQPSWQWIIANSFDNLKDHKADVIFNLFDDAGNQAYNNNQPVFINSVTLTLKEKNHPSNVVRFNGWPGFIGRPVWELSGDLSAGHIKVLDGLQRKYELLPDEPGFVSARVIAMIVNEACFAVEENVSSTTEIDTAMKLGTNYPKGPFEWKNEIGPNRIHELLSALRKNDPVYEPALTLKN